MLDSNPFILCDNLVKIYKTKEIETVALSGLDLEVNKGEVLAIVGPSGSGKSTLLNLLGGLDTPTSGSAYVGEVDLLSLTPDSLTRYRRDVVGFIWQQNARNLIPYLTTYQNICLPMKISGINRTDRNTRADELLEALDIGHRAQHHTYELSGGEQQRAAIAVALANSPGLLLADEPTGSVDTQTAYQIIQNFQGLAERFGVTILIVSHDPTISRFVDRTIAIFDGCTSFERVRRQKVEDLEVGHEAFVMVDKNGRFQIPPELIEQLGISGRVRLQLSDDHLEIWPLNTDSDDE